MGKGYFIQTRIAIYHASRDVVIITIAYGEQPEIAKPPCMEPP